jgi:ubiquinone/menaquinone biosynthesis C-methylase UbiE
MEETQKSYLPAAGHDWLLPLYDPIVKLLGGDRARRALVDQAHIRSIDRVLEIGCGTGTLVTLIKRLYPDVTVVGLDPDPKALARARRKAQRAAVSIQFDQGFSHDLPYNDNSFDRVFSSFMFHHLDSEVKLKTLCEVRRVVKPGGCLHLLDFGGSKSSSNRFLARLFHSSERLRDNFDDVIITLMSKAGLSDPKELSHRTTLFGPVAYYRASVVGSEPNST